jgi:hypothetical protein
MINILEEDERLIMCGVVYEEAYVAHAVTYEVYAVETIIRCKIMRAERVSKKD